MTKVKFDDIYELTAAGIGCWVTSRECLPLGTVRCIRGMLFYAAYDHGRRRPFFLPSTKEMNWIPVDRRLNTMELLRSFVQQVVTSNCDVVLKPGGGIPCGTLTAS